MAPPPVASNSGGPQVAAHDQENAMKNDSDIERDVKDELLWSPEIDETDIAVKSNNGVVSLTGFVHSFSDKYQSEMTVKRIAGVSAVANDLEVRLPGGDQLTDPELARNVAAAIRTALPLAHEQVKAVVQNGYVTLDGVLDWEFQREEAARTVRLQRGVKSVINAITLRPRVVAGDLKRKIQSALVRSAQLDANHISVETHGGTIVLGGKVRSWAEREEAQRTAWAAPGVLQVQNHITVGPA
jgi:osmotically-inducible protein OsmY